MARIQSKRGFDVRRISILAALGGVLLMTGLVFPAHWKSLAPAVVERAGRGTPSVTELGFVEVLKEKPGTAGMLVTAAKSTGAAKAGELATAYNNLQTTRPELLAVGGSDSGLVPVMLANPAMTRSGASVPVMEMFLPEQVRQALRERLQKSPSPGVASLLKALEVTRLEHFVPARNAGGQPYEATVLLAAFLYEGERFSASFSQELRALAELAGTPAGTKSWEGACLDLLTLGRRLNWVQLTELVRTVPDVRSLNQLASVARLHPDDFPVVYSACLMAADAGKVAEYLGAQGTAGIGYLSTAVAHGRGAVALVVQRQLPVSPGLGSAMSYVAPLVLKSPGLAMGLKALFFVLAMLCFFLIWQSLSSVERVENLTIVRPITQMRRVALTVSLVILLMALSEPFLLSHARAADGQTTLNLPMLSNSTITSNAKSTPEPRTLLMHLDISTIVSVALFAALQVIVYAVCLLKIQEIDRQSIPSQLKLRLLENEENLFDSGLYVGIAGTAAALILQVLGVIEANLLAAYSSNLFGILCVAFVKIRHVRSYKRTLILQSQRERKNETESGHEAGAPLAHVTA